MKIKLSIIYILLLGSLLSVGQVRIKMQKDGGVYNIPCIVNGLRLKFIFDTGASNVCISLSEAVLMLENGYLDKKDIIGIGKSQIADGSIINNTRIILREIVINGLILRDVEAVVISELKAPLLLGQSAIEKLGKIQIDGDEIIVLNAKGSDYSSIEVDKMKSTANYYYNEEMYAASADIYQKLYDQNELSNFSIYRLARAYEFSNNYKKALQYYFEIKDKTISNLISQNHDMKFEIFIGIGNCCIYLKQFSDAELNIQKSKIYANNDSQKKIFYMYLMILYGDALNCSKMMDYVSLALEFEAKSYGISYNDIFSKKVKTEKIGLSLYNYGFQLIECGNKQMGITLMSASAKNNFKDAINYCSEYNIEY